MTDVNHLKAKFETKGSPSTNGASPKPPLKPMVSKKPPASPKMKAKVNKLSPALMKKLEGSGSLTGTTVHEGEVRPGQKHCVADGSHGLRKSHSADSATTASPSPGAAVLASITRASPNSPRRPPPPPPPSTSPKLQTSPTPKHRSSPTTPPKPGPTPPKPGPPPPKPRPSPPKPRLSPFIRLDSRGEKARSLDVGMLPKTSPTARPLSTGADHLRQVSTSKSVPAPGSFPAVDTPHGSMSSARTQTPMSSSYEKSLDSPVHIDSPFMPRATSRDGSRSPPEANCPATKGSGSLEELHGNVAGKERAASLPRFSASPPPIENSGLQLPQSRLKSHSDLHLNRISRQDKPLTPPRKLSDGPNPSVGRKPALLPRPPVPRKPPSLTNLKDHAGYSRPYRSASSSRDTTPEPSKARRSSSRDSTPESSKARTSSSTPEPSKAGTSSSTPDPSKAGTSSSTPDPSKARSSSSSEWTPVPREELLSHGKVGPQPMLLRDLDGESEGTVTTTTESSEEERMTSPDTPASVNEGRKPPSIEINFPETGPSRWGGRNNVDSGFVSEAPEDLVREVSVDSVASTEEVKVKEVEVWDDEKLEKARQKRLKIAQELLDTEKTYVSRLKLIAVNFYKAVEDFNTRSKHVMPHSDVQLMFLNIRQIHQLNENILQELQTRMDNWSRQEGLGDVFCRLAPFLKLYSTYTAGFEDAMKLLTEWTSKEKRFDALVREFARETSSGLGVSHYMLEPVQRIPRYRLLLADYLKYLPEDSPDRPATTKALGIISEAADRTNDRIKELENSNTILQIQRSLQDYEGSLLGPSRIFLKKGMLQKFSRKTQTQRMFFLFSDKLLHTYPSGADIYKFRDEMPIFGMQVDEPAVSLMPFCFNVHSTTRSLILIASSEEEKLEWMEALIGAISDDLKKRSSLRRGSMFSVQKRQFGAKAPIMVPDKSVTMCQVCSAHFTFTFRRHHCRACGKVVCGGCSQWKAFLLYMDKTERVCECCFRTSKQDARCEATEETDAPATPKKPESSVLNLKAYAEDTVIAGYVLSQEGKKWTKLWYQIKQDLVLYKFRAHEDIKAINSMPLPGYIVTPNRGNSVINLIHRSSKKQLCDSFKVEDPSEFDNWISALEKVVNLEIPSPATLSPTASLGDVDGRRLRSQSVRETSDSPVGDEKSNLEQSI